MSIVLKLYLLVSLLVFKVYCEVYNDRPKIKTSSGDLILEPAYNKNIYLHTNGPKSTIFIGEYDMSLNNISYPNSDRKEIPVTTDNDLSDQIFGRNGILRRLDQLELTSGRPVSDSLNITHLTRRVTRLNLQMMSLRARVRAMETNKCSSRPCENGGTCLNLASDYHCLCLSNWEGKNCDIDVNECRNFAGTELGCQNGATCVNKVGSYDCLCRPGWYGLHCTRKAKDCYGGDTEMCGHGICLPVTSGDGIKCICDQGWTTNGTGPCNTDINECESSQGNRCSLNPKVDCINLPGSFRCGPCPNGYEGDGFVCSDIDECTTTANGGCSISPMVPCYNTIGSRICGPCPPGYQGDGVTCNWRGTCSINRGGCHPSAQCVDTPAIGGQTAMCICPAGMEGDGVGLNGCYISTTENSTHCENNPCGTHGRCHPLPRGYTCFCEKGYGGAHCESVMDYCSNNPCNNGGTCRPDTNAVRGFRCECTALFTGELCQTSARTCGGILDSREGSIVYPLKNTTSYSHNSRCAWVIHTDPKKVINVTFSKFDIEYIHDCTYDFLQIHDGRSSASQLIGRFCGNEFPKGGNIVSSNNFLYFWFRSDQTVAKDGFALHWTSIDPVCGGYIDASTHGHISSPGWPGKYPPNRDCYWHLTTTLGKRIQLHFFQLDIEFHNNCSFDYLAIYDGDHTSDALINRFCNSTQPAPVQSAGSTMLIHFHSDAFTSGNGFQISYATIEGIPGCGGLFTSDKGEIRSPSYNGRYLNNLKCEYNIRTPPNTKIRITFKSFKLERSFHCRYDYVKIYDGISLDAKLVGKFCGRNFPTTYLSSSNSLSIQFKSDRSSSEEGFVILFETVCHQTISGDSGTFTSPGYPIQYPANRICEYILSTSPGKAIVLSFQDFDIEDNNYNNCLYDNVEIRDGADANSTLLGRYCGGSQHLPPLQTSTFNYMFIKFKSDMSITGTGFLANFTTINTKCGGIYRDTTGVISYPLSATESYENNAQCTWMLIAPLGSNIKLTWNRFDLERIANCFNDYVNLTEVNDDYSRNHLGTFCGTNFPPALTTSTNRLLVTFVSDSSVKSKGFSFSYTFLDLKTHCGGNFIKTTGYIQSPGWPKPYQQNRDCTWIITVPFGQQVYLNISSFDLESSIGGKCDYGDFLEIRNGGTSSSPLIGKYCGTSIPRRITSLGNSLFVRFHSDFYLTGKGFNIEWDGNMSGCGGTVTEATGSITSPNYPQSYNDNAECFYKIVTSSGSRIRISFTDLDLEASPRCRDDYVEIYDGRDSSGNNLGRFCSMSTTTFSIETTSNFAYLKFRSDILIGGKGFSLNYYTLCNSNITGSYGVIESPNYPNIYPNGLNCLWTVTVPKGNKINITFTNFNVQKLHRFWRLSSSRGGVFNSYNTGRIGEYSTLDICSNDYVQLKDGYDGQFNTKLCGSNLPNKFSTSNNVAQIKFVTDNNYALTGFRLEWVKTGCGGQFTKDYGIFSFPAEKITTKGIIECEWNIETTPGTAVSITFNNVYMLETKNCTSDAIEVYDGPNIQAALITKICHRGTSTFQTISNLMTIRFVKRSDYRDVTFAGMFESKKGQCGGRITTRSGIIYSPNYPKNYDNDLNCMWYIIVPKNHLIELNVLELDLYTETEDENEYNADCADFIKFYDSDNILSANYTQKICPHTQLNQIISKSNVLNIEFVSDNSGTAKGFKFNFTVTCGAYITVKSDGILTNDKLSSQTGNRSCVWTIAAAKNYQKISFTLTHLSIHRNTSIVTNRHCPSAFLRILDGDDVQAPLIKEYCGRKIPPMIVSHGNSLTIELGSYTGVADGIFSAHYTTLDTACGGVFTSEEGSLASPNYPSSYPIGANCEWIINSSPGCNVYLTFETLNIEYSENCNEDYLEIRENDGSGAILGLYCGNEVPINMTVASKIFIKFYADSKGMGNGFLAHYGFVKENKIDGVNKGEVTSPLYPNIYDGTGEYSWLITGSENEAITITIKNFEIPVRGQICYNYLSIYDGYDETSPLIDELCGLLNSPEKIIRSSYNIVFIKLKLDETNTGSQFHLKWSQHISNEDDDETKVNCGSNLTTFLNIGENIRITSPNYGIDHYDNNLNCEWIYRTLSGFHLQLSFTRLELEERDKCFADYISVYSSMTEGLSWEPVRENFCTSDIQKLTSDYSNYIKINFVTDSSIIDDGFDATVSSKCGGLLTEPSGVIELSKNCWFRSSLSQYDWKIKVRPGRTISAQFEYFNITNANEYCVNYIKIYNGENIDSPMFKFCGYSHEDRFHAMIINSNMFYLKFRSVSHIFQTFKLRYEELNVECGGTSKLDADHPWEVISSPNYPSVPLPYSECIWVFNGPPGETLKIDFIGRFDLQGDSECSKESIDIRDGGSETSALRGSFCHSNPGTVKTTNNVMFIKYYTQIAEPRNGFKANVSINICGGTIIAHSGEVISPGYPRLQYLPVGTVCTWKIISTPGYSIKITPLDLELPESETNCGTKVIIEENLSINSTVNILKTFCGDNGQGSNTIETFSNEINIKYVFGKPSEYTIVSDYKGFRFKFNSSIPKCGGLITSQEGFITTPGYPRETKLHYCQWLLKSPNTSRKIRLEILDGDFVTYNHKIGIYNDHSFQSVIKQILDNDFNSSQTVFESTGYTMAIYLWLTPLANKHRFKAKFSTNDLSECGEIVEGTNWELYSPNIKGSYFCEWQNEKFIPKVSADDKLNTIYININVNTTKPRTICRYLDPKLTISTKLASGVSFLREICDNRDVAYRLPSRDLTVKAFNNKESTLNFHIHWKMQPCGGLVEIGEKSVDILMLPTNYRGSLDCAWIVRVPSGSRIELQIDGNFESDCENEFLKITRGWKQRSAIIGDYCRERRPSNSLFVHFSSMYIEYHTSEYRNSTLKLTAKSTDSPCGGLLVNKYEDIFSSPNYPKGYKENQECSWEITTDLGSRITLQFIERFVVEDKPNCTSDAVIIYDWKDKKYIKIAKVCGRVLPPNYNSTFNKMKVVFSTNDKNNLDGFKAQWKTFCGGFYNATPKEQFLYSPGYPTAYTGLLECNYIISSPENRIIIQFLEFELEGTYPNCNYDNITFESNSNYASDNQIYCGKEIPPTETFYENVNIVFKTDRYMQKRGFKLSYQQYICGREVTKPTILTIGNSSKYENNFNCTWTLVAPKNKIVVLSFSYIDLEESVDCSTDYISVYEGKVINSDNRIAVLCGYINSTTVIKSIGNTMLLNFISDIALRYTGFKAEVYFSYSKSVGCGGNVDLTTNTEHTVKSPLIGNNILYEPFLDCTWYIRASSDQRIQVEFVSFHIASCRNLNQTALGYSNCHCDYIEIRDGLNPNSLMIGKYCGHSLPPKVSSSGNLLSVRLYTDGELASSGFELKLKSQESECQQTHYTISKTIQKISSPNFSNGKVGRGLHCAYYIHAPSFGYMCHIRIRNLDLIPGNIQNNQCEKDKLIITTATSWNNQTFGAQLKLSLQRDSFLNQNQGYKFMADFKYPKTVTYCGKHNSVDLYGIGDIKISLQTSAEVPALNYKGFQIEINEIDWCHRNYTESEGRITSYSGDSTSEPVDCYTLITAPENFTISAYFFGLFVVFWDNDAYLEFFDGNSEHSPLLRKLGGQNQEELPIFTTGRYLLLHNHRTIENAVGFDMNFMTTNKGRGCGGQLHNVMGIFTSPMYPYVYRAVASCEWELETPIGSKLLLHFEEFDLGNSCDKNYLQILDRKGNIYSTYCEEPPADYKSPDNYVKVVFKTTRNNAGKGWVAEFLAVD